MKQETKQSRRLFLKTLGTTAAALSAPVMLSAAAKRPPNIIIVFADDLGYGDLGCYGHPTIRTPNLDKMAAEGQRWTSFYAAASVCTPSRTGLLTGRLPIRSGMASSNRRVLFPDSAGGLPQSEVTIAEGLKKAGYATAAIGKWHQGHLPQYLPTEHGFDSYLGVPYSNDMDRIKNGNRDDQKSDWWNLPLMRDKEIIERPTDQNLLSKRYTEEAIRIIKANLDNPFFIYLAHNMPHIPLFRSKDFADTSLRGIFGDVIEEIDWSVGQIIKTLRETGLEKNTIVFFTSDNGPWLTMTQHGGSPGLLREGKGCTMEGGMREPCLAWWPGKIKPGVVMDMGSTLDLLPTSFALAGVDLPKDRTMDGYDLSPTLLHGKSSPRNEMFYYRGTELYAVRKGAFKAHFITELAYGNQRNKTVHQTPILYNLNHDPSEQYNVAGKYPEVIAEIKELAEAHLKTVKPVENQLEKRAVAKK